MSDIATLHAVADAVKRAEEMRETLQLAANLRVEAQMETYLEAIERAVMAALYDEHTVTDVARAYTTSGKTPNRNAIHAIKRKHDSDEMDTTNYPFEWVPRVIETARGTKTIYDIHAVLWSFGPDGWSGEYTFRYNPVKNEVEPILGDHDPYPLDVTFYRVALSRWIMMNPYPQEES